MRSHLLEGTVRHRRVAAVRLRARARRLLLRARSRRARRGDRAGSGSSAATARTWCRSATTTTWPRRPRTCRAAILDHLRSEGHRSGRLADHPGHEPAGPRLRIQPGQLLPLPRRTRRHSAWSSWRCTTRTANDICTRSSAPARTARFVASMDKAFFVSPFIEMDGRYTVHVRDDAAAAADRHRRTPGWRSSLLQHEPRPAARAG